MIDLFAVFPSCLLLGLVCTNSNCTSIPQQEIIEDRQNIVSAIVGPFTDKDQTTGIILLPQVINDSDVNNTRPKSKNWRNGIRNFINLFNISNGFPRNRNIFPNTSMQLSGVTQALNVNDILTSVDLSELNYWNYCSFSQEFDKYCSAFEDKIDKEKTRYCFSCSQDSFGTQFLLIKMHMFYQDPTRWFINGSFKVELKFKLREFGLSNFVIESEHPCLWWCNLSKWSFEESLQYERMLEMAIPLPETFTKLGFKNVLTKFSITIHRTNTTQSVYSMCVYTRLFKDNDLPCGPLTEFNSLDKNAVKDINMGFENKEDKFDIIDDESEAKNAEKITNLLEMLFKRLQFWLQRLKIMKQDSQKHR